jgi:hypothetical protein
MFKISLTELHSIAYSTSEAFKRMHLDIRFFPGWVTIYGMEMVLVTRLHGVSILKSPDRDNKVVCEIEGN